MRMRLATMTLVLTVAALAGCGGGDGGESKKALGGAAAADAFIGCFKRPGYEAKRPKPREESLFALQANRRGFKNVPVNVAVPGSVAASAFLAFFESEERAKEAMKALAVTAVGDVPPSQRGSAVIGYLGQDDKRELEAEIARCASG